MNRSNARGHHGRTPDGRAVLWTVYEDEGRVHAVADVPQYIPKDELGFGANHTSATVFVGSPGGPSWPVAFPVPVKPAPVSVSYNNGVFEVVFAIEDQEQTANYVA